METDGAQRGEVRRLLQHGVEDMTVYPCHRAELRLADVYGSQRPEIERRAVDSSVRARGTAYRGRFRHCAEISWRMPELYAASVMDGRMTIDHIDTIWRRMDRHPGIRQEIAEAEKRKQRRLREHRQQEDGVDPDAPESDDDATASELGSELGSEFAAQCADERAYSVPINALDEVCWEEAHGVLGRPGWTVENGCCVPVDQSVELDLLSWLRIETPAVLSVHRLRDQVDRAASRAISELRHFREDPPEWSGRDAPRPF